MAQSKIVFQNAEVKYAATHIVFLLYSGPGKRRKKVILPVICLLAF
jgi:hypothetical protein